MSNPSKGIYKHSEKYYRKLKEQEEKEKKDKSDLIEKMKLLNNQGDKYEFERRIGELNDD